MNQQKSSEGKKDLSRLTIVLATWCPHCHPLSLEKTRELAAKIGVPYRVLDIDKSDDVEIADRLVREYGDDAEDYLIPQVFAEFRDGSVQHIFTGFSESVELTKRHWSDLLNSSFVNHELKSS